MKDTYAVLTGIRRSGYEEGGRQKMYSGGTIDKFRSHIRMIFRCALRHSIIESNPLWGSALDSPEVSEGDSFEREFVKLRKSLQIEEEISVFEQVLTDCYQDGEKMGVALMFALGLRNSEACAINFNDIRPIQGHPDSYCLWVFKTTKRNKSDLKASGKTRNADRLVPITDKVARFFLQRQAILEQMVENGSLVLNKKYENAAELPIVCIGQNYLKRCNANYLTKAGKAILQAANLNSDVLGYIDNSIRSDGVAEKEATSYLFRRNFATHLHLMGLTDSEIQYVIGHEIEDPAEFRNYFTNSEKLYPIKLKMDNRHCFRTTIYLRRRLTCQWNLLL